jgi:hypothetical protein
MLVAAVALGVSLAASEAQAQAKYGTAGCGLGSIVFGSKPGFIQVLASTTNGSFSSQTFGITSGTSNCVDTAPSMSATRTFIQANREALAKDIARGQGETIVNLTTLAGCKSAAQVGTVLQQNFKSIFPDAGVSDRKVTDNVIGTLKGQKILACSKTI